MLYLLLYSEIQDAYNIETNADYENKPKNGFEIVKSFDTYAQCYNYYYDLISAKNEK
jgi:hypothetical protein